MSLDIYARNFYVLQNTARTSHNSREIYRNCKVCYKDFPFPSSRLHFPLSLANLDDSPTLLYKCSRISALESNPARIFFFHDTHLSLLINPFYFYSFLSPNENQFDSSLSIDFPLATENCENSIFKLLLFFFEISVESESANSNNNCIINRGWHAFI
jgi:hypothetical protein